MRQSRTQLRLKHHQQCERAVGEHQFKQVRDHGQLEQKRHRIHNRQHDNAGEHLHCARALNEQQHAIEDECGDGNFEHVAPVKVQRANQREVVHAVTTLCGAQPKTGRVLRGRFLFNTCDAAPDEPVTVIRLVKAPDRPSAAARCHGWG